MAYDMKTKTRTRIVFLFGSGISIRAGMPNTQEITDRVLSGRDIYCSTTENYVFGNPPYLPAAPDENVPRIVTFLSELKLEIERFFLKQGEPTRQANYEDLYYLASQIYDSLSGDFDNPGLQPLIDKLTRRMRNLVRGVTLFELTGQATNYIYDVVWNLLDKEPGTVDHLRMVKDACSDKELSTIDIFTLNHDVVLERLLSKIKTDFTDGFTHPQIDNIRYWKKAPFGSNACRIRLFKLHGSVNWFQFRPDGGGEYMQSIGSVPAGCDIQHTRNPKGTMQMAFEFRPMLLIGTFNKMLKYTTGIFIGLFYEFSRSLRKTSRLVVSGYSFGDKGVNTQIKEWLSSLPEARIIVIHPNPKRLKAAARPTISNEWERLRKRGNLVVVRKKIETTTWRDVKKRIA